MTETTYINEYGQLYTGAQVMREFNEILRDEGPSMVFNGYLYPLGACLKAVAPIAYNKAYFYYLTGYFWEVPSNFTAEATRTLAKFVRTRCSAAPEDYDLWLSGVAAVREEFGLNGPRLEMV